MKEDKLKEERKWREGDHENVIEVTLGHSEVESEEQQVMKALEHKYDTLRDKLLLEVHILCH